jgi:hypothetical protein
VEGLCFARCSAGDIGEPYRRRRRTVGDTHARRPAPPRLSMTSYSPLFNDEIENEIKGHAVIKSRLEAQDGRFRRGGAEREFGSRRCGEDREGDLLRIIEASWLQSAAAGSPRAGNAAIGVSAISQSGDRLIHDIGSEHIVVHDFFMSTLATISTTRWARC